MKLLRYIALFIALVASSSAQSCVQGVNCLHSEGCVCASTLSPIATSETPQFVIISFNDAITDLNYMYYYEPLLRGRTNPDGNPISASFYVPHEYTDYARVNDLYNAGYEIAIHTVTKNVYSEYWQTASVDTLVREFQGQRQIISTFANIPEEDLIGGRVPNYELPGDRLFQAYSQSGIQYDNTLTSLNANRLFPFSLDYSSDITCVFGICPEDTHQGLWVAPIIDLIGNNLECNNLQACRMEGSVEELSDWLYEQFLSSYAVNRAPLTLVASAAWFISSPNNFDALALFLDRIGELNDVFLVSHRQVIDWMRDPIPVESYSSAIERTAASCQRRICTLDKEEETRYMSSCVACPEIYPWLDNPKGEATMTF